MSKQSSSRNHRVKRLRPEQCLRLFLLVAVGIWLVYQLGHSYERRAVAIQRRWLDRKSLIKFAGAVSSLEDAPEISGGGIVARSHDAVEWEPRSNNKGREDEGDEEDDGLFGYDDGDDGDFHPENGEGEESNGRERRAVRRVNTTDRVEEDGAAQLVNAAGDGIDMAPERNSSLNTSNQSKNTPSVVSSIGNNS